MVINHLISSTENTKTMEFLSTLFLLLSLALCLYVFRALKPNPGPKKSSRLPPGPKPLPIIGNILDLGLKPHQSLAKLAKVYGPLMYLKLGSLSTVIVSSPEVAKIVLQTHDQVFSSRIMQDVARAFDHDKHSVVWLPVNRQWRKIRKICKENMFSIQRLDLSQGMRREKLRSLFDYVDECSVGGRAVDIGEAAFTTLLNLMSATLFSVDFAGFGSDSSQEYRGIVSGIMANAGKPNLVDFFPLLRLVDPQGIRKKGIFYVGKCFEIFDEIIQQRVQKKGTGSDSKLSKTDFLEALLDLREKNEHELSFDDIKHLFLDLFVAGTDTSSGTIEWAMAELMRNPDKMLKARNELRNVIGQNEQIQESDISKLHYLQAVVKETFRLHPTVPLLLPHMADENVEINGYIIPKNTQVLLNAWAIGRDSSVWSDPDLFMPERFLESEIDFGGQHFELIPFGGGRRICPGLPLAYRMVHLVLATLISNFDWKLLESSDQELDMEEEFRLSLQKAIPLKAIPIKL